MLLSMLSRIMLKYFLPLDSAKLSHQQKKSRQVTKMHPLGAALSFLASEASLRGYFTANNLSQAKSDIEQLPLLTWPLLDYLGAANIANTRMVELGSGNSTIWFSKRFKTVVSYETNTEWYNTLKPKLSDNVQLSDVSLDDLLSLQFEFDRSDYLLIDFAGPRTQYIQHLLNTASILPANIILDNSDWYRNGAGLLRDNGYMEIPFFGFKSGKMQLDCTSLFINRLDLNELPFNKPEYTIETNNLWDRLEDAQ